jgi:hypothetical protein
MRHHRLPLARSPRRARHTVLVAALAAAAAACTAKTETPAGAADGPGASAAPANAAPNAAAAGPAGATPSGVPAGSIDATTGGVSRGASTANDSASSAVVMKSVPPTAQQRRIIGPDSTGTAPMNQGATKGSAAGSTNRTP